MTRHGKLLWAVYIVLSTPLIILGFAGLFSRKMGFRIPLVSTDIIPALHRHAVWGETLRGRAILLGGEDWFFLIVVGVVILLGIVIAVVGRWIGSVQGPSS